MGGVWLHSLPDVVRSAGLQVSTWPGWETRSRSSGGYERILAIGIHHDAADPSTSLNGRCTYAWDSSNDRPIGALYLHSDGQVVVGAAGATNTQGKGGPLNCSKGTIPVDEGNKYMISIEASNNGVGEPWPVVQQNAYVILCAVLCAEFELNSLSDVIAHFEWTDRKIDPAGPSRYASGGSPWNMGDFRHDVMGIVTPPQPPLEDDVPYKLVLVDDRPPHATYLCDGATKSWVRDGDAGQQINARLEESRNGTVPSPWDGFVYREFRHGGNDVIASYGPIVGPRPDFVDEYGRW